MIGDKNIPEEVHRIREARQAEKERRMAMGFGFTPNTRKELSTMRRKEADPGAKGLAAGFGKKKEAPVKLVDEPKEMTNQAFEYFCYDVTKRVQNNQEDA